MIAQYAATHQPAASSGINAPPPLATSKSQEERIDDFVTGFENQADRHIIPASDWVDIITTLIPPANFQVI